LCFATGFIYFRSSNKLPPSAPTPPMMTKFFDHLPCFAIGPLQIGAKEAEDVARCKEPMRIADGTSKPDLCPK